MARGKWQALIVQPVRAREATVGDEGKYGAEVATCACAVGAVWGAQPAERKDVRRRLS